MLDAKLDAQDVVDDVVVRVVELEMPTAPRTIVRPKRQVQQLVRQHEHQFVFLELLREGRIDDDTPRGKHAHRRHAVVERHACFGGKP